MADLIFYARISCRGQLDGESIACQLDRCRAFAAREGHQVIGEFTDLGLSGADMDGRPAVREAIALAVRRKGTLVVSALSRLGRSVRDVLGTCDRLSRAGAGVVSLTESIDTSSATGRMLLTILSAIAAWERETICERTVQVMGYMRREGKRISGTAPFGWSFDAAGSHLVEVEAEQRVIRRMQALRAAGSSYQAIATVLNDESVAAKLGGRWSSRSARLTLARLAKLGDAA